MNIAPELAGHAEFARDCLAENRQLKAINADLLAALEHLLADAEDHLQESGNSGVLIEAREAIKNGYRVLSQGQA